MEEENVVYYRIYPELDELDKKPTVSLPSVEERLEELKNQSLSIVFPIAGGYIWQHEPFNLRICSSFDDYLSSDRSPTGRKYGEEWEDETSASELRSADSFVPHLAGKVKFGDNLEDEWFVVYLLFEISRRFLSVSITVRDSDGEFLLIESAYCIPKWLEPHSSHNRVFIRQGAVHFVRPALGTPRSRKPSGTGSLKKSLYVLADSAVDTRAAPEVQNAILGRIAGYPEKATKNMHRVRCKVPLAIAHILSHEPQLISLAIESFYTRDIDSMKVASRMEKFLQKGKDGNVEVVDIMVRMSRAMYAQLVQQVFQAPRNYSMPALNSPGFKEAEIGMKITVGFEMMYWERSSSEYVDDPSLVSLEDRVDGVDDEGPKENLSHKKEGVPVNDVAWKTYRASLERNGYFRGLLEGSKEHRDLLQAAVAQYRSTSLFARVSTALHAPVRRIAELLSMAYNISDFSNAGSEQSDDDGWLYDGEEDLATALLARQKEMDTYESQREKRNNKSSSSTANLTSEDLEIAQAAQVVKNVKSFVNKISSFEGAEIPGNDEGSQADDEAVNLDMSRLLKELESVFGPKEISNMLSEGLADEHTDSSSDGDLDESTSGSDDEMESTETEMARLGDNLKSGEVFTSTDKERGENLTFSGEYAHVLDKELKSSSLARSFAKGSEVLSTGKNKVSGPDSDKAEPVPDLVEPDELEPDDENENENDLVDVDVNLVESLLRSYMFQQGMPGPASNLLGAMGVELPDNSDQRPGTYDKLNK